MSKAWLVWTGAIAALGGVAIVSHMGAQSPRPVPVAVAARPSVAPKPTPRPVRHNDPVERPQTPLRAYEHLIQPFAEQDGRGQATVTCGLRTSGEEGAIANRRGRTLLTDPTIRAMADKLSPREADEARDFSHKIQSDTMMSYLHNAREGCARLSREIGLTSDLMQP